jgi:hypothetical protein
MSKDKHQKQAQSRFKIGSHGGCEALLFEFRDQSLCRSALDDSEPSEPVRIAARTFEEALDYLHWREEQFSIGSVQNLGLILLVSGSPVD